jgi:hypothetical protein
MIGTIIGILFTVVVFGLFLLEMIPSIIDGIKQSILNCKKENELASTNGKRIQCIHCSYCKKRIYKPFYSSMTMAHYIPTFCLKFKVKLPNDIMTLCQAKYPEDAEREKTTKHYKVNGLFQK